MVRELSDKITKLEAQHKGSLAVEIAEELADAQTLLLEELFVRIRRHQVLSQKLFYEQGNKLSRLLTRFTQQHTLTSTVHHVTDASSVIHSKNENIAQQFQCFYSKLYNLRSSEPVSLAEDTCKLLIQEFLAQYSPCALSTEEWKALEARLSLEEWKVALKAIKPGKSPGLDGFPAQYYKSFADLLAPGFLKAFNTLSTNSCPSETLLEAYISVIPKQNKDPANVANYGPISLLNMDVKLFSNILAT